MRAWPFVLLAACGPPAGDPSETVDGGSETDTGGGGGEHEDSLLPLAAGRVWTYDVVSTYSSCPGGRHDQRVTGVSTTEGRSTFDIQSFCGPTGKTFIDGDVVEDYYDWGPTGWLRSLDEPVADGHTWTTTNGSATFSMTYSDAGSVGGHDDCWKVTQNVSYTSYWIYCRGVGLVAYEMIDLGGGTIKADLR
ncbi:MAG: hypothetical protein ABI867_06520 [Kofleriaceae bacterium]